MSPALDSTRKATFVEPALVLLRVTLGVIMLAHGIQKLNGGGFAGTTKMFETTGVPLASIAGPATVLIELVGGPALIIGLLTPLVAGAFAVVMLGAIAFVHGSAGFYAADGGYEFVLLLAVVAAVVAITGGGRFSADAALGRSRSRASTPEEPR